MAAYRAAAAAAAGGSGGLGPKVAMRWKNPVSLKDPAQGKRGRTLAEMFSASAETIAWRKEAQRIHDEQEEAQRRASKLTTDDGSKYI